MKKTRKLKTTLNNNGILLEACLDMPDAPGGPCPGVVLCHPDPRYGGDMTNNIIMAVSWALTEKGIAGMRYNSRGVGRSRGFFGGGVPEQDDARAALSFLVQQKEIDSGRIGIMGYSFGGRIALPVGGGCNEIKAIAGVSPVVPPDVLIDCAKPKLIVCGSEDDVVSTSLVLQEAAKMSEPKTVEVIPNVDHFWWGYEEKVAELVAEFFVNALGRSG
ncbi:MAG: Alpha/beta hydrolase family protein [Pelotomaculum sp. PtaB.Bin013]|uniref:Dienelactone hydrolase family protein n=1 Tax=Pelotomaculum isophthalicicum JI TaxID=947010 RepID=A0A9X4H3U0_9FIRM|nr:CocE/NonD family hydrolase [Pelotomaculum isophthalicicum]MDF9408253.1 dienelactone hydrolase family protein [Pelotomaculum isophthalicicum JI]OPX91865.1 MAG: Alpha/beta hydrolase family protein [Pelotomaculum sp. PtaB.Bin013]